ncbi:response regulator transcription factor [Candidatus Sumerlaeota bacterium]|nr:response regulator transcription factor [Candidatus Sumerlaeota bacterium]
MTTKILIADDHKILREGLRSMLQSEKGFEVVGEAGDGRTAVSMAMELHPDIVIIDIAMPDLNGIEATRQISAKLPRVKVIALSMYADGRFIRDVLDAGASGYLLKDSAFEELAGAIRAVAKGGMYLRPAITEVVVKNYVQSSPSASRPARSILTAREREVLQPLAEGKTTKEIAGLLGVSVKTIETHRKQVMDKLKIRSVAELTKYAIREGLTSLNH